MAQRLSSLNIIQLREFLAGKGISTTITSAVAEQGIDGPALLLMMDDFAEFKEVLPKVGDRLKVKGIVKMMETSKKEQSVPLCVDRMPYKRCLCDQGFPHHHRLCNHMRDEHPESYAKQKSDEKRKRKLQPYSFEMPPAKKEALTEVDTDLPRNPVVDIEKVSIPRFGQRVRMAIDCNHLTDYKERAAFVRECVARYELVLPRPTELQYTEIAKVILAKYPCLKDRGTEYWSTFRSQIMQRYRNNRRDRSAPKRQKLPGVRLPPGITQPAPTTNTDSQFDKDACEGVAALQKRFDGKAVAPSPVVKKIA